MYHILSETEIWPSLRLLHMNSTEKQCRDQLNSSHNERIEKA